MSVPNLAARISVPDRVKRIARRFVAGVLEDDVLGLAAEMAYRFLFAVFPFILFVAALGAFVAGLLPIENPAGQIVATMRDNLPASIADSLAPELERLIASPRADLISIGAVLALWAATGGMNVLIKGMNRAYDVPEARPLLRRYAVAVTLTLFGALGVVASFIAIVGGALVTRDLAAQVGFGEQAWGTIQSLRWPVVFTGLTIAAAALYRLAPNAVVPWRWLFVGSAAFSLAFLAATGVVGFYAVNFADFGATYGSLGGLIVLMLWFYVSALVLLLGAELSAAFAFEWSPEEVHQAVTGEPDGAEQPVRG